MDRLNKVHRAARVQLPQSVLGFDDASAATLPARPSLPIIPRYVGIIAFVLGGAFVITAASLIALSV